MNELDKNLLTGEAIVFATKKHWFAPVRDSAIAALLIIGSFVLRWLSPDGEGIIGGVGNIFDLIANLALIVGILWIVWNVIAFLSANFGVSNMRVLRYEGLVQRRSSETLLDAITDVRLSEPALGRMLGYGDLDIFTAAGEAGRDDFQTIRDAARLRTAILEQKVAPKAPAPAATTAPAPAAPATAPAAVVGESVASVGSPTPTPPVTPPTPVEESAATIARLAEMRDQGLISDEDFETKKAEILGRI